ncbi:MAG: DUF7507 domain-containing protein, partial [Patescibacteria group bacterium]
MNPIKNGIEEVASSKTKNKRFSLTKNLSVIVAIFTLTFGTAISLLPTQSNALQNTPTGTPWTGAAGGTTTSKTYPSGIVATIGLTQANPGSFTVTNPNNNLGVRSATAGHFDPAPNTPATTSAVDITSNPNVVGSGQPAACTDGQVVSGAACPIGTMKISFSRPVRNPIIHIVGLGGGGTKSTNGVVTDSFTSYTEFTIASSTPAGTTFGAKSAGASNLSATPTTVKAATGAIGTLTPTCAAAGAASGAGCGSVDFNGTFSSIDLTARLITTNTGPNRVTGGDAYAISFTLPEDFGDAPASYDAGVGTSHILSDLTIGPSVTEEPFVHSGGITTHANQSAGATADTDDSGMVLPPILLNSTGTYPVTVPISGVSAPATLCGYLDSDKSGTFTAADKNCVTVNPGDTSANLNLPLSGVTNLGTTFARFRLSYNSAQANSPTGFADSGEVEDYPIQIVPTDLTVTKSVSPAGPYTVGQTIQYTVTSTNNGTGDAVNVVTTDKLPAGLTYVSSAPEVGAYDPATGIWNVTDVTNPTLKSGESKKLTIDVTIDEASCGKSIANDASIATSNPNSDNVPLNNLTTNLIAVENCVSDLAITKKVDIANPKVGDIVTYTLDVVNNGPQTAGSPVITDVLPAGVVFVSATPTPTSNSGQTYNWNVADLANGATTQITYQVKVTQDTVQTNSATVTSNSTDTVPGNNAAKVDVDAEDVVNNLELKKKSTFNDVNSNGISNVGDTITYEFTVTNNGNYPLTNVTLTDNKCSPITGGPIATLAVGATDSTTFTCVYNITQSDIDAGVAVNSATVSATDALGNPVTDMSDDLNDPATPGNDDPTKTPLITAPKIEILKKSTMQDTDGDGQFEVGETILYNFTVNNTGNVTLSNVTVTDNKCSPVAGGPLATLAVAGSDATTFTCVYTLTQADIDAGKVENSATADATD